MLVVLTLSLKVFKMNLKPLPNIRYQLWILAAAALVFFTCLGAASLWDEDETLYASCAREMMDRGDWVVPMFNGRMFPDKPPIMFWMMMAGFELFGQNEFGARFFSAVLGVATALLTYHLGRLLFNKRVGLWGGLITASSIIFTVSARAATVDSALVFVTTLSMLCFVIIFNKQSRVECVRIRYNQLKGDSIRYQKLFQYGLFIVLYICMGLAVLSKGPVGFLLPMASIGLFVMIVNHRHQENDLPSNANAVTTSTVSWKAKGRYILNIFCLKNFCKSLWQLRPLTGLVILLAVALPWFILVGQRTDGLWLEQFFAKFNLRPFMHPILGHSGPIWYYIPFVLIGFFPWSVFLGPALIESVRQIRDRHPWRDGYVLLSCWFGVFFVFWSICSTKLPHYVLPAYPALALLTGGFLETWITQPAHVGPSWIKNAWITTIVVGLAMIIAVAIVSWIYLPGEEFIGLVGLILVLGGGISLYLANNQHRRRAVACFAGMAVIFLTAMFGFAAQRVDHHQNAKRLLAQIRSESNDSARVCAYRFFRQSMVYYAGQPVEFCDTPEELQAFVEKTPTAYIITLDKYEKEIQQKLSGKIRELSREQRFLAKDEMVVFAPIVQNTEQKPVENSGEISKETSPPHTAVHKISTNR